MPTVRRCLPRSGELRFAEQPATRKRREQKGIRETTTLCFTLRTASSCAVHGAVPLVLEFLRDKQRPTRVTRLPRSMDTFKFPGLRFEGDGTLILVMIFFTIIDHGDGRAIRTYVERLIRKIVLMRIDD